MIDITVESNQQALKAYKKLNKSLQRRIQIEKDLNKSLLLLLRRCEESVNCEWLKKDIQHQLKLFKYKYY